jgi:hypothetical protein
MKLKQKFIFLICFLAITHAILYCGIIILNNTKNELTIQFNNFKNSKRKTKILFLGDSHVARSIDATKIDSAYSLAYFGENNMMNFYKLKYCLDHHLPKPNYIILPCDIITFSEGLNLYRTNKIFYYYIIPFLEIKNLNKNALSAYYDYFKIKLIPYSEWQYALNRMNINRQKKSTKNFAEKSIAEQQKEAKRFIQDELLIGGNKSNFYSKKALNYLQETIKLCKDNHIKLVFVKFPITQTIFNEIKYHVDSNYIANRPAEKIIRNDTIPILDFEYVFLKKPELFFDSHHLNTNGKNEFTIILKQELDSLFKHY